MSFEEAVIQCGAPALCGIKPSCLFSIRKEVYDACKSKVKEWHSAFAGEGKYIVALPRRNAQVLFFVYDKNLLERQCGDCCVREYLKEKEVEVAFLHEKIAQVREMQESPKDFHNAVLHVWGYFKKEASAMEKQGLLTILEAYRTGKTNQEGVIDYLNGLLKTYPNQYLQESTFLTGDKDETMA